MLNPNEKKVENLSQEETRDLISLLQGVSTKLDIIMQTQAREKEEERAFIEKTVSDKIDSIFLYPLVPEDELREIFDTFRHSLLYIINDVEENGWHHPEFVEHLRKKKALGQHMPSVLERMMGRVENGGESLSHFIAEGEEWEGLDREYALRDDVRCDELERLYSIPSQLEAVTFDEGGDHPNFYSKKLHEYYMKKVQPKTHKPKFYEHIGGTLYPNLERVILSTKEEINNTTINIANHVVVAVQKFMTKSFIDPVAQKKKKRRF